jgi:multidrug resistance efflux pump
LLPEKPEQGGIAYSQKHKRRAKLGSENLGRKRLALAGDRPNLRVSVPMMVEIGNIRRSARDWNVSGFALDKPLPGLKLDDVRTARVVLRVNDLDIGFDIPCQVTRETEKGAIGFQFLGAFTEQAALLYRISEDHLAGQVTQLDTLLRSSPVQPFGRKRRKLVLGVLISVLGVSVAALTTVLLASLLTVRSRVGAVSVEGIVLRAPATGLVAGELPPQGRAVREGQPLFSVVTADMTTKIAELSAELDRLRTAADYIRARLDELKEVTSNVRNLTERRLDEIKAKITALDTQIAIYTNLINNRQYLADKGFHAQSGVDEDRRNLQGVIQAREDAQSQLTTAATQAKLAKSGVTSVDWRNDMETPETMRLRVAESEASIAKLQAMLNAMVQSTQVTSPCNCIVHANTVKTGEIVETGALVSTLRPAQAAPVVVALISAEQSAGLTVGNAASVSLVNGLAIGRLEKLSCDDQESGRVGFFPFAGATTSSAPEPHMVRATISVPDGLDASLIGTPAQVAIRSNPLPRAVSSVYALVASR